MKYFLFGLNVLGFTLNMVLFCLTGSATSFLFALLCLGTSCLEWHNVKAIDKLRKARARIVK